MSEEENRAEETLGEEPKESEQEEIKVFGKKVSKEKYLKALEEVAKAEADRDHWKNEYYRAYADTQNLRKSLEEEKRVALRYRSEGFLTNLLPALDAFRLALVNPAPTKEAQNYQIGFQYIYNQLIAALEQEGVKQVKVEPGTPFDLNSMHAVDAKESDEYPPNTVLEVYANGYLLHDRLIKPAMVLVSKKKAEPQPEEPETNKGE